MFRISARTVLELGSELISSDIIAFYELIKNAIDAGSKSGATIRFNIVLRKNAFLSFREKLLNDKSIQLDALKKTICEQFNQDAAPSIIENASTVINEASNNAEMIDALKFVYDLNSIEVLDDGTGMTRQELQNNFLVIGTSSRKKAVDNAIKAGVSSPYLGEKGIGRLSAMRLGTKLKVVTKSKEDKTANILDVDWDLFNDPEKLISEIEADVTSSDSDEGITGTGTRLIIRGLSEDWTQKRLSDLVNYDFARLTDPFANQFKRPRVAIYWNGERESIPRMPQELLDSAHASLKVNYEIIDNIPICSYHIIISNLGYEHPVESQTGIVTKEDFLGLIGTSGDIHESALVDVGPFEFEAYWFNRQRFAKIESIGDREQVKKLQRKWSSLMLFRDGFRVFPYGDEGDDWLKLDRKAMGRSGYTLNKAQFMGRCKISRTKNPYLLDQTNREGLRENQSSFALINILQMLIQEYLFTSMKSVDKQYKNQKVKIKSAETELDSLINRTKGSLRALKRSKDDAVVSASEEIEQTLFSYSEIVKKYRTRIIEVEQESRQMTEMAGIGLMVEVVAHELARASENALVNLNVLSKDKDPEEIDRKLASLKAQMKTLLKRLKVLDEISIPGRQRKETVGLISTIEGVLEGHQSLFERDGILVNFVKPSQEIKVQAVKGMMVQIIENLISNSKYWMLTRKNTEKSSTYIPCITIEIEESPLSIRFSDNGRGISPENYNRIFQPFFSLKEKAKRRGLGLYVASECAEYNGAVLYLDRETKNEDGRLNTFVLELEGEI
ncbi:sensor histidine kinase [Alkalimonas mucilaginosa]|uniref:histidine kinase n=1 Tax=Alkalimonas mucilaginosa TaxID=3057676 RepID=A0ABU7JI60_9GAMM|nr:sensor histidine kinase [Alkalimonas sp. MEB004]MEE2025359.1 sensor histidine kinase [Alkalimonas sp. MEB004]